MCTSGSSSSVVHLTVSSTYTSSKHEELYAPSPTVDPHIATVPLLPLLPPSVSSFSSFWSFSSPVSAVQSPISLGTGLVWSLRSEREGEEVWSVLFHHNSTTMRNLSYQAAEEFSRGVRSHLHCLLSPLPP